MRRIKSFYDFIGEAISLSDARRATKLFLDSDGKNRYNQIFQGKDRLYYDFTYEKPDISIKSDLQKKIEEVLSKNGYYVADYAKGLATKEGDSKNIFKIQKLLVKFGEMSLRNEMDADPFRFSAKKATKKVVISRHGIDLAGQSTGRDWVSCKNIISGIKKEYVWTEIEQGSLIAYLIEAEDLNIQKPIARILIGVYINKEDPSDFILYPDISVYGNYRKDDFKIFVTNWCESENARVSKNYSGSYDLSPKCAADYSGGVMVLGEDIKLANLLSVFKNTSMFSSGQFYKTDRGIIKPNADIKPEEFKGVVPFIGENLSGITGKKGVNAFLQLAKKYCTEKTFASVVELNSKAELEKQISNYFQVFSSYLTHVDDLNSFEDSDKVRLIKDALLKNASYDSNNIEATKNAIRYNLENLEMKPSIARLFRWIIS